ncbi:hypothetical protein EDEG_01079 [Edhazardia aedis USNM 41457]|uniref:MPN domain-containing protein n=1 Tax=Edhazardia aedis (strain USNM 41457) TaxID=1003232 RepID=J9DAF2_EDHAE|nr:hypothetical protein EDEG_01079 [Edhazardia aedis USNM 41457]|eukprot:EJW04716.1 hypothetical protein EDEG_01079 [Edhazardia aedis USNM 41457]
MDFSRLDSANEPLPDSGETVQISSLALLKMLRHGRAGIPLEVMGLMLGKFVDDFTIIVNDVYAMPQTGTGVTVEAVDPVYQTQMSEALSLVNKDDDVVGWYHSHPGFGCWLSSVDMATQDSFERLHKRAIAVVIDPIQSVKGKVVLDAFRLINNNFLMGGIEPRQVTNNMGFLAKPSIVALLHGLNRQYYSFRITYKKTILEQQMLLSMSKKSWAESLKIRKVENEEGIARDAENYLKTVESEKNLSQKEVEVSRIGKIDYRKRLLEKAENMGNNNILRNLLISIHSHIFRS